MSLASQIHNVLKNIAEETYPDKVIKKFYIEIHSKELRGRHGDYNLMERKIRIFNLSRDNEYVIKTCIHELAHHCEFSIYGDTGHSKRFYEVYRDLIITAVRKGIINYEKARTQTDSNDINVLEKYFGILEFSKLEICDEQKENQIIKVYNSYSIKDKLSDRGYRFNATELCWLKEFPFNEIDYEVNNLSQYIRKEHIKVQSVNDLSFKAVYYLLVKNAFSCKEELKKNGYYFNGFNKKGNVWVKKIASTDLKKEEDFLRRFTEITYKVEGMKNKKR